MNYAVIIAPNMTSIILSVGGVAMGNDEKPFAPNVDTNTGAISVPEDYTLWPTLGAGRFLTWTIPNTPSPKTTGWIVSHVMCQPGNWHLEMPKKMINGFIH